MFGVMDLCEPTKSYKPSKCYDCGLVYSSDSWADVVIPDVIWHQISPTGDNGGVLCFNCMNRRLTKLGLTNVPYEIASGPFSFQVR